MNGIKNWINQNIDKRQLLTIVAASAVIGGTAYGLRKAGLGKVASVVKGA